MGGNGTSQDVPKRGPRRDQPANITDRAWVQASLEDQGKGRATSAMNFKHVFFAPTTSGYNSSTAHLKPTPSSKPNGNAEVAQEALQPCIAKKWESRSTSKSGQPRGFFRGNFAPEGFFRGNFAPEDFFRGDFAPGDFHRGKNVPGGGKNVKKQCHRFPEHH